MATDSKTGELIELAFSGALSDAERSSKIMDLAIKRPDIKRLYNATPDVVAKKLMMGFMRAIRTRSDLRSCEPESVFNALADTFTYQCIPEGPLAEAYLIPYGRECCYQLAYRGHVKLMMMYGGVVNVNCREVRVGDTVAVQEGDDPKLNHTPSMDPARMQQPITHVYCVITFGNDQKRFVIFDKATIERHKEVYSKSWRKAEKSGKKDSTWHSNWLQMAYKTCIIAVSKYVPKSEIIVRALEREMDISSGDIVDAVSVTPASQPAALPVMAQETVQVRSETTQPQPGEIVEGEFEESEPDPQPEPKTLSKAAKTRVASFAEGLKRAKTIATIEKSAAAFYESALTQLERNAGKAAVDARIEEIELEAKKKAK